MADAAATTPCPSKLHTFTCGCSYISPPCKCHSHPEAADQDPIADATTKSTPHPSRCRDCMLKTLQGRVDAAQEWYDYLCPEYGDGLEPCEDDHYEWKEAKKELAKAKDSQERLGHSIRATMFDYSGLWTKVPQN